MLHLNFREFHFRDCPKRVGGACGVTLRSTSTVLFDPFWPPCASQIHAHSVALTPFRTVSPRTRVHKPSNIGFRLSRGGKLKDYGYGERLRMLPRVWRERRLSGRRRGAVVLLLRAQEEVAFRVRLLQRCPPSDGIRDHRTRVPSRLRPRAHEDGAFLGPWAPVRAR